MTRNQTQTIHFTSIALLRSSHADQGRVTRVANNLKKLNPEWHETWFFPAVAVGLSNGFEDISWVEFQESVHLDSKLSLLSIAGAPFTFNQIYSGLSEANLDTYVRSRADCEAQLAKIDEVLSKLAGRPVSWTAGVAHSGTISPAAENALQETAVTMESPEETPTNQLINVMQNMEVADIMAAITAVNSARGGLLKGAQVDELTVFVQSMTGNQGLRVEWPVGVNA